MKKGTCKHFNGCVNETCEAGVRYDDVTTEPESRPGKALRVPCHSIPIFTAPSQLEQWERRGTCEKYEEPD